MISVKIPASFILVRQKMTQNKVQALSCFHKGQHVLLNKNNQRIRNPSVLKYLILALFDNTGKGNLEDISLPMDDNRLITANKLSKMSCYEILECFHLNKIYAHSYFTKHLCLRPKGGGKSVALRGSHKSGLVSNFRRNGQRAKTVESALQNNKFSSRAFHHKTKNTNEKFVH